MKKIFTLTNLILLLIIGLATYLRFVNFPLKYGFDIDPARDALIISAGAKNFWFPLVGAKSGIGNFSFGPWYYYELIIFKIFFPFTYSPWIFMTILSLGFTITMYFIGKELENEKFGLILALISATSPEQIGPTTGLSNPNMIPFYAGLVVFITILYLKKINLNIFWLFTWGMIIGIGINDHYEIVLLLPFPIFSFLYKKNKKAILDFLLFLAGILFSFIPLFIYNFEHNFIVLKAMFIFILRGGQRIYIPNSWNIYIKDFWWNFLSMLFGIPKIAVLILVLVTLGVFLWKIVKKELNSLYFMILFSFIFDFLFLRYFLIQRELYYFLFIHVYLFIIFGYAFFSLLKIKYVWILILIFYIFLLPEILRQDYLRVNPRLDQIRFKRDARILKNYFLNDKLSIYGCNKSNLFKSYGIVFFLDSSKKLNKNGKVILLFDKNCSLNSLLKNRISFSKIKNLKAVEINSANVYNLKKLSWIRISPRLVYNKYLAP